MTQILSRIVTINAKLKMAAAHLFYLLGITVFSIAEDHIRRELVMMLNVTPCLHVTVLIAIALFSCYYDIKISYNDTIEHLI